MQTIPELAKGESRRDRLMPLTTTSSLAVAAMRITFMAEGLLELSRNGVKVDGFDDMLSRLAERNFATEVVVHGRTQRIEANEKVLEIPMDALTPTQPVFDMIPPKLTRLSTVERKREEERPTRPPAPSSITL